MSRLKVLIVRPDRIGDVVLSTPLPREIKRQYPNSIVAVLLREYTKDIYINNPYVDQIITIEKSSIGITEYIRFIKEIRQIGFSHALMLLPNEKINWLLFFAGVKSRIGVGHKFFQFMSNTKSIYRHKYVPLRHEADYCIDSIRKIGITPKSLDTEIHLSEAEKSISGQIRKKISPNGEYVVGVNCTSGNSAPNLRANVYLDLIKLLIATPNVSVVITDNEIPEEIEGVEGVFYPNKNKMLRESIINFSALDLLISASTGPMHIAAALKIRTLSLFCPLTACSPQLWGPKGNESHIILPEEIYCRTKCPGNPKLCAFEGDGGINAPKVYGEFLSVKEKSAN